LQRFVSTIWDDGLVTDLPLMEALESRGLTATFALSPGRYSSRHQPNDSRGDFGTLVRTDELEAYSAHDICSHGWTHADLRLLDDMALHHELSASRDALVQRFDRPIAACCYPYGVSDRRVRAAAAGYYSYARSLPPRSRDFQVRENLDPCDIWPTAHWTVPGLTERLLSQGPSRAVIWGHTYEFARVPDGFNRVLEFYDALASCGVRFVSFPELCHARTDE
jgi:peptidoglycan/xylan/chitin deacetylase (PgdA/CDA1 family)